jgi:hypothetical protein
LGRRSFYGHLQGLYVPLPAEKSPRRINPFLDAKRCTGKLVSIFTPPEKTSLFSQSLVAGVEYPDIISSQGYFSTREVIWILNG